MEIKTKLAALLRRWAYALHPETPATLPPGYQVKKVVSNLSLVRQCDRRHYKLSGVQV